jgi:hypothetical protein
MSVFVCALQLAGCNAVSDYISGEKYRGPRPAAENITNEVAIVRDVQALPLGDVLLMDRVRYTEAGDPHNVNRVVRVGPVAELRDSVAALNLVRGDRVLISTRFTGITNTIGSMSVPDWPGHTAYEYPISLHAITSIARIQAADR